MLVRLPYRMAGGGIDSFMAGMFTSSGELLASSFELDFTSLGFIEPAGVASLANAVEYAMVRGCSVKFEVGEGYSAPISYLDDSGFFRQYRGRPLSPAASLRGTTAPLARIAHADSHFWIETSFGGWLAAQMGLPAAAMASIHTCMKEIFNNIENHSGIRIGCIHMQHFPNKSEIIIAVSDFGVGIPVAIRRKFPGLDDAEAIHHASQPGVTSGSTLRNQGVGLDLLITLVVGTNKGSVHIHSGHGKLACKIVSNGHVRKPWQTAAYYPGTMIEIRLNTDTFVPDDLERESLEW